MNLAGPFCVSCPRLVVIRRSTPARGRYAEKVVNVDLIKRNPVLPTPSEEDADDDIPDADDDDAVPMQLLLDTDTPGHAAYNLRCRDIIQPPRRYLA